MTYLTQLKCIATNPFILGFSLSVIFNCYLYNKFINMSNLLNKNNKLINHLIYDLQKIEKKMNKLNLNDENTINKSMHQKSSQIQSFFSDDGYFFADI